MSTGVALDEDIELMMQDALGDVWVVIIHNDDTVEFDHVVNTLVSVLKISTQVAAKHAYTAHINGEAVVAAMSEDEAVKTASTLRQRGVPATAKPA